MYGIYATCNKFPWRITPAVSIHSSTRRIFLSGYGCFLAQSHKTGFQTNIQLQAGFGRWRIFIMTLHILIMPYPVRKMRLVEECMDTAGVILHGNLLQVA
jgi:hypothetical protein